MTRSREFNNYLNRNILNKTFLESDFLNKPFKRKIETCLAQLKKDTYESFGIIPESAISLTGPAGKVHCRQYKDIGIKHVYIPEYSLPTYQILYNSIRNSEYREYATVRNVEFFECLEELCTNGILFSDIDFDGTSTIDSVYRELAVFPFYLSSMIKNLTTIFTLTVTLTTRRAGGQTLSDLNKTLINSLNLNNKFRIVDMFLESYKDGQPMMTIFFIIGNSFLLNEIFPNEYKQNAKMFKNILPSN